MSNDLMELVMDCEKAEGKPVNERAHKVYTDILECGMKRLAGNIKEKIDYKMKLRAIESFEYIKITDAKINSFLERKVKEYNATIKEERKTPSLASQMGLAFGVSFNDSLNELSSLQNAMIQSAQINRQLQELTPWLSNAQGLQTAYIPSEVLRIRKYTQHQNNLSNDVTRAYEWVETLATEYSKLPPEHVIKAFKENKGREVFDYFTIAEVNSVKDPLLLGRITNCPDRFFIAQWGDDVSLDDVI